MYSIKDNKTEEVAALLLETGSLLMSSGASTGRVRITVDRIAKSLGFSCELMVTHRALMLTITDENGDYNFSKIKRVSPHGVNFKMVSGLSHLSWNIIESGLNLDQIKQEIKRLKSLAHYPRFIIVGAVGLADLSFCRIWGGGIVEMLVVFIATSFGIIVRQECTKRSFNPYICVFLASLMASSISGLYVLFNLGAKADIAFSTSILFLVPGVPLINSITDLIDGNILNGMVRGMSGLIIAFAIAMGMYVVQISLNI